MFSYIWLLFVASFVFISCGLGESRLGIFLLFSIPAPFVDFDTPKLYPFGDSLNLSSAPIGVALELILQYSALLLSHAHATSFFSYHGSRRGRSRLAHHLLWDSIIWALGWAVWIKVLIPTLLVTVWGIFGVGNSVDLILILQQCCLQCHSSDFFIGFVSLRHACSVRYKGHRGYGCLYACQIMHLRLCLVHPLIQAWHLVIQKKIRIAWWSWTTLPRCFLILRDNILICSIVNDVWFKYCLRRLGWLEQARSPFNGTLELPDLLVRL